MLGGARIGSSDIEGPENFSSLGRMVGTWGGGAPHLVDHTVMLTIDAACSAVMWPVRHAQRPLADVAPRPPSETAPCPPAQPATLRVPGQFRCVAGEAGTRGRSLRAQAWQKMPLVWMVWPWICLGLRCFTAAAIEHEVSIIGSILCAVFMNPMKRNAVE